ncbi:MAG: hypothetical protein JO112_10890, partial [Planctomycetes bacterium]|nr:hypothetical protein [Planctomycetota bacterium]
MRTMVNGLLALLALTCLLTGGCQRLNDERTVEVSPLEEQMLTIDAPRRDQKV